MWQSLSRIARQLSGRSKHRSKRRQPWFRQAFLEGVEPRCMLTSLWISASPMAENAAGGFWLGRSGDATASLDVQVQLSSGTATAGSDFVAFNKTITLDPGQTETWVEVQHLDDTLVETDENYFVSASASGGLSASGEGWIADNDGSGSGSGTTSGSLSISGGSFEENSPAGFWLSRSGDTSSPLDVQVSLTSDTATAGSDFVALNTTIHFDAGETQTWIEVEHIDDTLAESTERYTITASSSAGGSASGEGWIVDNDGSGSGSGSGTSSTSGVAPTIQNWVCTLDDDILTIKGSVVDDVDPTGYWVYFGDLLAGNKKQVTDDDKFALIIPGWSQHGDISAWVTDNTGLTSPIVWDVI